MYIVILWYKVGSILKKIKSLEATGLLDTIIPGNSIVTTLNYFTFNKFYIAF